VLDTIRSLLQRARSRFVIEQPPACATSTTRRAALRCRSRRLVLVCRQSWRAWLITALATFAVIGILYFFAAVTTEELLRPLYDPVQRTISELAVGPFGFLQTSAFVVLGLSLLALQHALARHLRHTVVSRIALVLLALCGVASFVAAAFPTNLKGAVATVAGEIHESVAGFGYAGLIIAIILLSAHFRRDERWRTFCTASSSLAVIGVGGSIFMGATSNTNLSGLSQRVMVIPLLLWVVLTALRLRSLPQQPQEPLPVAQELVRRATDTERR
jgi:hypothetical membrane protein